MMWMPALRSFVAYIEPTRLTIVSRVDYLTEAVLSPALEPPGLRAHPPTPTAHAYDVSMAEQGEAHAVHRHT